MCGISTCLIWTNESLFSLHLFLCHYNIFLSSQWNCQVVWVVLILFKEFCLFFCSINSPQYCTQTTWFHSAIHSQPTHHTCIQPSDYTFIHTPAYPHTHTHAHIKNKDGRSQCRRARGSIVVVWFVRHRLSSTCSNRLMNSCCIFLFTPLSVSRCKLRKIIEIMTMEKKWYL